MKAGSAKSEINFPEGFLPTEGFSKQIDHLHVRIILLENIVRYAIVSIELTSLPQDEIEAIQTILRSGINADECFICVTHTFSAPHLLPEHLLTDSKLRSKKKILQKALYTAVTNAAQEAALKLTQARLMLGTVECGVNATRDVETPNGWWIDTCGLGMVDNRMTVLRVENSEGVLMGQLIHYPIQSSVLDGSKLSGGGKAVSGDLAGVMCAELERRHPGMTALFLIGAAGDQVPVEKAIRNTWDQNGNLTVSDKQDNAIKICSKLGRQMADAVEAAGRNKQEMRKCNLRVSRAIVRLPAKLMERDLHKLKPTRIPPYQESGECTQTVELLTIGDLQLVCVKPELCCITSRQIDQGYPNVRVATLVNGGAKYMADESSYARITYEAMNSPFGRGAAEKLVYAARQLLEVQ